MLSESSAQFARQRRGGETGDSLGDSLGDWAISSRTAMTTLLVGGSQGLVALQEQPFGWEVWEHTDGVWANQPVWALARLDTAVLAGADTGLWHSDDQGATWRRLLSGHFRAIATHPTLPHVVFAGAQPPAIWQSGDAGATWQPLDSFSTQPEAADWHLPGATPLDRWPGGRISAFAGDPVAPLTVYTSVEIGGVYRSDDGGASWQPCHAGLSSLDVHAVVSHPQEPATFFAATETGVYRSDDRGQQWRALPLDAGAAYTRALLVLPPSGPHERAVWLAGPADVDPWGWAEEPDGARCRLLRSDDDGATWQHITEGLPTAFAGLISTLVADPADRSGAWLGTWDGRVYRTRDRGLSWQQIAEDLGFIWTICPLDE